jgi:general secretion pathway protein D
MRTCPDPDSRPGVGLAGAGAEKVHAIILETCGGREIRCPRPDLRSPARWTHVPSFTGHHSRLAPHPTVFRRTVIRAFHAAVLAFALALAMPPAAAADDEPVTLNFVNADIEAVVKAVAEITGRNFVVDPRVKGTINIISARPVARNLVYPTLLSALRLQGYAAVESEGVVKIVPEADAKQQGGAVARGGPPAAGDQLVTKVVTLKYESAAQLVNILRPLIAPNNTIAAYPNGNALVITDYADNLKRLDRIIASLDQPPSGDPVLIPVRNASALDLVPMLNRLLEPTVAAVAGVPADAQQRVMLVADPRSNSILVRADNPGRVAKVRQLIEQLDTPGRVGGNIFIIYLKNAEAARIAQTLRALLSGGSDAASPGAGSNSLAPVAAAVGATVGGATTGPTSTMPGTAAPTAFTGGGATIQADTANNALIISAPEPVYNNLRAVIEKLDIRRAQVFIEGLIVEVTSDRAAEFGIQWQVLSGVGRDSVQGVGGTNFGARGTGTNIIDASINLGSVAQGLNLGIINGSITIPGLGLITNLGLLARALETESNANILSTPTLLTLDNEEAKIVVGQNVPFITGQYTTTANTAAGVSPFQTIERKDVGLTLRVKPQITEGGSMRLVLYQEVSRVDDKTNPAGIITNKRSLESSVVVDDNQIVVLGGLVQDSFTDGTDKVPVVGDMPVFGPLFRYDNRKRTKTNLLVFLKPTVVRGAPAAGALTQDRYDYLMGEQQRLRPEDRFFWNDPTYPQVPPLGTVPGTPAATPPAAAPAPPKP